MGAEETVITPSLNSPDHQSEAPTRTVMVQRIGYGIGDMVIVTPLFRLLKEDGYHVTFYTSEMGRKINKHNPFIDRFLLHDHSVPPDDKFLDYMAKQGEGYDKVIALTGSIENTLLKSEFKDDFFWTKERRHQKCNVNYYDHTIQLAGYENIGMNGELFFTPFEVSQARNIRKKYRDKFLILWVLSGSSPHKSYPYAEQVACQFLDTHPDSVVFTVGDTLCQLLEWQHPRTKHYNSKWDVRHTLLMTSMVDLVIGPETGVLNAAGCYDTPKIILLSHSSHENLSKYWKNCYPLSARVDCHPCHRMHYTMKYCNPDPQIGTPICMTRINPWYVYSTMELVYNQWRDKHGRANSTNGYFNRYRGTQEVRV